jgi:hypothetical protein
MRAVVSVKGSRTTRKYLWPLLAGRGSSTDEVLLVAVRQATLVADAHGVVRSALAWTQ